MRLTKFRANIYQLVDEILEKNQTLILERDGRKLKLSPLPLKKKRDVLSQLKYRPNATSGEDEDFAHIDWTHSWNP